MSAPAEQARIEALVADLRKVAAFADQHQDDLEWFVSQSGELRTPVSEITVKEGSPAEAMFVILEGELRARREMGPAGSPVYTAHAGDVTGVRGIDRMKTYSVTVRAVLPMRTLAFPASKFPELFQRMPELSRRLVGLLTDRVRNVTRDEQQRDRKSTRLNSSHGYISYAVFCLKKKKKHYTHCGYKKADLGAPDTPAGTCKETR